LYGTAPKIQADLKKEALLDLIVMHTAAGKENTEVSSYENRQAILSAIILGVSLLVGLAAGGYFVGKGSARFKSEIRTVTVKGLVEKEVKSDQAAWVLHFRRASDDLKGAHEQISAEPRENLPLTNRTIVLI
jgi:hypothetical protein